MYLKKKNFHQFRVIKIGVLQTWYQSIRKVWLKARPTDHHRCKYASILIVLMTCENCMSVIISVDICGKNQNVYLIGSHE